MKLNLWDLLAIALLLGILLIVIVFGVVFADPYSSLNPFPPLPELAPLIIPSPTATLRSLPPLTTATSIFGETATPLQLKASSTLLPSSTGFRLPTYTNTPTNTPTPTNTRTPTNTPTHTPVPTQTTQPTYTLLPTYTMPPTVTPVTPSPYP